MKEVTRISTSRDVAHELTVYGAECVGQFDFPKLKSVQCDFDPDGEIPGGGSRCVYDFVESFGRNVKNCSKSIVHHYIHDYQFEKVWKNPDKYLEHYHLFKYVFGFNYTLSTSMPLSVMIYNQYRNQALNWYLQLNEIEVIPDCVLMPEEYWSWCWDGLPEYSALCCSTNGRVKSKESRMEFARIFKGMEERLHPTKVYIVGRKIEELETDIPLIYLPSRSMKMEERFNNGK